MFVGAAERTVVLRLELDLFSPERLQDFDSTATTTPLPACKYKSSAARRTSRESDYPCGAIAGPLVPTRRLAKDLLRNPRLYTFGRLVLPLG
jgi:hypothetical protein